MSLDRMEGIELGTTLSDIEREFGSPTEIIKSPPDRNSIELFYADGDYNRMAFEFDRTSKQLHSKFWDVRENDPERRLQTALTRYPRAHFKFRESKFVSPHGGPGYAWYDDQDSGVSIQIRKDRNVVESIVWCKEGTKGLPCRRD